MLQTIVADVGGSLYLDRASFGPAWCRAFPCWQTQTQKSTVWRQNAEALPGWWADWFRFIDMDARCRRNNFLLFCVKAYRPTPGYSRGAMQLARAIWPCFSPRQSSGRAILSLLLQHDVLLGSSDYHQYVVDCPLGCARRRYQRRGLNHSLASARCHPLIYVIASVTRNAADHLSCRLLLGKKHDREQPGTALSSEGKPMSGDDNGAFSVQTHPSNPSPVPSKPKIHTGLARQTLVTSHSLNQMTTKSHPAGSRTLLVRVERRRTRLH